MDRPELGATIAGVGAGVVAFGMGLLLAAALVLTNQERLQAGLPPRTDLHATELVAWTFYSAHFVGLTGPNHAAFGENIAVFAVTGATPSVLLVYLIPPVSLVLAGFFASAWVPDQRSSADTLFVVCSRIGVGYGVTALLGAVTIRMQLDLIMRPDPGYTIVLMAIAYPVVFAGLGTLLAVITRASRWAPTPQVSR